jgi:pyruvate/2-oxoglutarate dehydrogenase complex dihydrolipoamide acyltransferase (E2) component
MTSLGTLELQLTANQAALYQQLNNTRTYATQIAKDIEKQINQAFGSVGGRNSLAGLNQATAQAASAGQAAGRTFTDRFKNAVEPIKGILSNVFNGVFVGAGIGAFNSITGVVGSALGAVQQFAGEIFNVTKDFQGFESSLKTFLKGNQKEIDDFVGKLEKFAATTPFELKELQQGAIQNLATGAKPDQIIKDLKTIGDVAAGANARLGDLMEVYAKSRTEGRLQNEDIDQFTGRGVQLRAELAKMLGAKEDEIRQLATDGKLEFRHLEEALRRMSAEGGVYFGAMENKAKTLEGRLSNVQDTFYQFQKSIGVAFEPIMNFIVQTFGDIVSGLTSSKGVLEEVKKEAEELVKYFQANPELIQALNKAIQELVSGAMKGLLWMIKSTAEYLKDNPTAIKDATKEAGKLVSGFGNLLGILGKISSETLKFATFAKDAFSSLDKVVTRLQNGMEQIPVIGGILGADLTQSNQSTQDWLYGPNAHPVMQKFGKLIGYSPTSALSTQQPQPQPQSGNGGGGIVSNMAQGVKGLIGGSETLIKPTPAPASNRGFGMHKHPIYGNVKMHYGQDFPDPEGTPIKAPLSGRIITAKESRSKQGAGTIIELETITAEGQKIVNSFFHLSKLLKQVGETVKQGEIIGKVGSTGGSTGSHTHWEVSLNGKRIDPMSQLGKSFNLGQNPTQQGLNAVKQFFTPAQNALSKTPQGNDFISQVAAMSDRLGINPEDIIKVMMFETGGTLSPKKHSGNKLSATGLIGFTRDNEKELGISLENLAKLSQTEQLKYVEKYLKIHSRGKALDTYQKVVSTVFHGNPGGSLNVGDGNITLGGYMKKAEIRYGRIAKDLVANARSTSQPPQTPQQSPQIPGSAAGGNAEDQRNLVASRRKIAESKYNEIKGEIEAATTQADNAQKQQRELDTKRREVLDKQKRAEFAANEALAPNDAAKKNIQEDAKLYEISNRYNEDLIKKSQDLNDLVDARSTKLKILAEAKKRGETVSPSDAGMDYSKSINQLKWVIDETKELRDIELATYDLNQFNAEKEVEKNKDRQREIERLSRAHEAYINQLRLEQSLADDATKQNIQSKIDKAQIEHQAKITLMPLQNQLNDLQGQKVYLLGKGGLKADSDQVRGLQKDIDELVATINAIADKSGVDLKIFENQKKQIELQNQGLKESVLINSKASSLLGQARLIRGQGGNEYKASALEAEAATMQEQLRYKQELLQIEQQIAAVKGTANEYTEQEIATLQANAEAINKINLEGISQQVKTLGKDLLDISKNALGSFFGDIISGSKSAGDAFRDLVGNIAQQLTQLAVNSLISSIFSGGLFGGGEVLAKFQGGIIPNYASGGAVAEALHRERSMSGGKTPVLAALTPGEMVLTIQQTKRFQELRLDKVLNFANGGVVGGGQNLSNEIGSKNTTINIPVNVEGGGNSSVDVPRLENSLRSVILAEIQKQQRPGGALNR